ncbi:hypothetical protein ACDF64_07720 [Agromyces sp. MMS24-JH15]|uniref:hypothetical protein n=1 Tax=Agromyces sp. MMS24-JH15 TaxID=3243765 RepID=UPI0037484ACC
MTRHLPWMLSAFALLSIPFIVHAIIVAFSSTVDWTSGSQALGAYVCCGWVNLLAVVGIKWCAIGTIAFAIRAHHLGRSRPAA